MSLNRFFNNKWNFFLDVKWYLYLYRFHFCFVYLYFLILYSVSVCLDWHFFYQLEWDLLLYLYLHFLLCLHLYLDQLLYFNRLVLFLYHNYCFLDWYLNWNFDCLNLDVRYRNLNYLKLMNSFHNYFLNYFRNLNYLLNNSRYWDNFLNYFLNLNNSWHLNYFFNNSINKLRLNFNDLFFHDNRYRSLYFHWFHYFFFGGD